MLPLRPPSLEKGGGGHWTSDRIIYFVTLKIEPCSILNASTDVDVRPRRVDHPMASDVVARDKVMNIQFIKWRTKPLSKLLGEETLCMTCLVLTIEIMTRNF